MKKLKLIIIYARWFLFLSGLTTLACLLLYYYSFQFQKVQILTPLIWLKLFTSFLFLWLNKHRQRNVIFFYRNIGLGDKDLMLASIFIDLSIFITSISSLIYYLL